MPSTTRTVDPMIAELEQESTATRRMLERVPGDKLGWRPHPRSMTLGQLAWHVAALCGDISNFLELEGFDVNDANFAPAQPRSHAEVMEKFSEAQASARNRLENLSDDRACETWRLTNGDAEIFAIPKIGLARSLMFNHLYHHRGQLSVYLRLLDVPVPVTYGRSADENPFG
jgi:uncharacterized damage-inducible protein DinB